MGTKQRAKSIEHRVQDVPDNHNEMKSLATPIALISKDLMAFELHALCRDHLPLDFHEPMVYFSCFVGGSSSGRTHDSGSCYGGSNPPPPAIAPVIGYYTSAVPSSSGLGYRPLTPKTRVRVPLGLPSINTCGGYRGGC